MENYKNLTGNSIVAAYETGTDYIMIRFYDAETVYKYSYRSASERHVEKMKALAKCGKGLGAYVTKYINKKIERKPEGFFIKMVKFFKG